MTDYTGLIARLEQGSGEDRELAYDVCLACGYSSPPIPAREYKGDILGSLDAALAFADSQLPGWGISIYRVPHDEEWFVELIEPKNVVNPELDIYTEAATPARALCAATVRALQAKEPKDGG